MRPKRWRTASSGRPVCSAAEAAVGLNRADFAVVNDQAAMSDPASDEARTIAADIETLHRMGYRQELVRRMSGFSNYAISLSIICILSGGITSFHQGLCSVGGAAIGLGWPAASLLALAFAATMGQVASAFPTAGGLYHWAAILGDRGWGWATAWFNLAGLVTALAAVNVGTFQFGFQAIGPWFGYSPHDLSEPARIVVQIVVVLAITGSQALVNHMGIRATTWLTDFSGYLILVVAGGLTVAMLWFHQSRFCPPRHLDQLQRPSQRGPRLAPHGQRALALCARLHAADVHHHGFRRLGSYVRGNGWSRPPCAAGDCPIGPRVGNLRLDSLECGDRGHSQHERGGRPGRQRLLLDDGPRAAQLDGADLLCRNCRGAIYLRTGDPHVGIADDLRIRPRRRIALVARAPLGQQPPSLAGTAIWTVAASRSALPFTRPSTPRSRPFA